MNSESRTSVLESPWYWIYAFCAIGLALALLVQQRSSQRQLAEERQAQSHQRAKQIQQGQQPTVEPSTRDSRIVNVRPLLLALAAAAVVGWTVVWYRHFYRKQTTTRRDSSEDGGR